MMFVLQSTMEAALEAERERERKRMSSMVAEYGKGLARVEGLARQLAGWLSAEAGNITPLQMATLFWQWDDEQQAAFFNALQDVVTEDRKANPSDFGYVGVPAGEGQWYHMAKHLNESGRETLTAMHEHMMHRKAAA